MRGFASSGGLKYCILRSVIKPSVLSLQTILLIFMTVDGEMGSVSFSYKSGMESCLVDSHVVPSILEYYIITYVSFIYNDIWVRSKGVNSFLLVDCRIVGR